MRRRHHWPPRSATAFVRVVLSAVVVGALGAALPTHVGASTTCTKRLAAGGDLTSFVNSLNAGDTGCLASGATFVAELSLSRGGRDGAPVTITSTDPDVPATIYGRVVTHPGAVFLTLTNLRFDWDSGGRNLPSITIGSDHVSLTHDDIQNHNTSICVNVIADPLWGTAHATLIDHDRIHNCGVRPVTSFTSPGYFSHALYISGYATTVTNNYIYGTSGKGVLLRGSVGAYIANNAIDDNGTGIAFGDLGASGNDVGHNIITNSNAGCDCNAYGVFAWWGTGPTGSGNAFHDNCLYGNQQGDISVSGGGFSASSNRIADPLYTDAANRRYTLSASSPCLGDGPDTAQPGSADAGGRDTSPPSVPTGLARSAVTPSSLEIAWAASTDNVGVTGYDVYDGGVSVGSAPSTSFRLSGLACGTPHRLTVVARDAAGNRSAPSSAVSITTTACTSPTPASVSQTVVDGSTVAGAIRWGVQASAPGTFVSNVEFLLDGSLYHAERYPPYAAPCDTCSFDTTTLPDGIHTLAARAYFGDGSTATASASLTVANAPDHAMVTQSVGTASGGPLVGDVKWNAWPAAPASVVRSVYFFLDGALYHAEQYAPYGAPCETCAFDTASIPNGVHTFTVLAVWADGGAAVASSARTVAN